MASIYPFRALRFSEKLKDDLPNILCPPYDILNDAQRHKLENKSPYSMVKLELPTGKNKYKKSSELLKKFENEKILCKDEKESFYIYEEKFMFEGKVRKIQGIFCTVKLESSYKKIILSHEKTFPEAINDRLELIKSTLCNLSPIYSLYEGEEQINKIIETKKTENPQVEVNCQDNISHKLWILDDKESIKKITACLQNKILYIADGHHRYQTALKFREINHRADKVMMFLADINQKDLIILPTHRLINVSLSDKNLKELCGTKFKISNTENTLSLRNTLAELNSRNITSFGLYCQDKSCRILTYKGQNDEIDVTVLHRDIIDKISGNIKIDFETDFDECIKTVNNRKMGSCLFLNPTSIDDIKKTAQQGKSMPEKSTYFYPKIITGLVINKLL